MLGMIEKTAYRRRKGRSSHPVLVEFGEKVLYKPFPGRKISLMSGSWTECSWLLINATVNILLVLKKIQQKNGSPKQEKK